VSDAARDLVARSCLLLDDERFDEYVALYARQCRYSIRTYSPDLRKEVSMLDLDRPELEVLLQNLPRHVRLPGRFTRQAGAMLVESSVGNPNEVSVTTSLVVVHTDVEGLSRVFAAGRYRDRVEMTQSGALLREREVRVETRQFGPGSHIPL
jgi:3-phenylpropionate/cinnamic acid dioxygenase small subunit